MRFHRIARTLECWQGAERMQQLVCAQSLAAVRYEPVLRQSRAAGVLDLTFIKDGSVFVLPLVYIDNVNAIERESDPLIWPALVHDALEDDVTDSIAELVMPWLYSYLISRQLNRELVNVLATGEARETFLRARNHGFLGAAPLAQIVSQTAPYVYAIRFIRNRSIGILDPGGATGAALVGRYAREVRADLGDDARNEAAAQWYGLDVFGSVELAGRNVLVSSDPAKIPADFDGVSICTGAGGDGLAVAVTVPVPLEILFSFDPQDGHALGEFRVKAPPTGRYRLPRGGAAPPPSGGSSGRILIALPPRYERIPDADSDSALELARRLRAEGFEVDLAISPRTLDLSQYDIVHIFSAGYVDDATAFAQAARAAGVAVVITANLEDIADRGWWGAHVTPICFKNVADEQSLRNYAGLLVRRRLSTAEYTPDQRQAPAPDFEEKVGRLLGGANMVFVSGEQERDLVAGRFGRKGPTLTVAPYINSGIAPQDLEAIVGYDDFVLSHAPIEQRSNQLILARAAQRAALPLVIAGPVADPDYLERIREFSDARVLLFPDPTEAQLAALYRRARVFADVSWIGVGLRRIAQAAAMGCALVVPQQSYAIAAWGPGLWVVDPASEESVAVALGDAWSHVAESPAGVYETSDRITAACDPFQAIVGTLAGYTQASS
jgi:glycosyltransferase involved in cell wall biosynthesis